MSKYVYRHIRGPQYGTMKQMALSCITYIIFLKKIAFASEFLVTDVLQPPFVTHRPSNSPAFRVAVFPYTGPYTIEFFKSVGMTLAKVKEQDGMTIAKVKEQDGMTLARSV